MEPKVLLINPWIYDFSAYDLWSKPLGLLSIASLLRRRGLQVHLVDCLDIHHPGMTEDPSHSPPPLRRAHGTGKFWRQEVPRPVPLKGVPRTYSRYGIDSHLFKQDLAGMPWPDAVLVTSLMTYWYPGVQKAIALCKETFPDIPIILGGIYARLCRDHAENYSGADRLISEGGSDAIPALLSTLDALGIHFKDEDSHRNGTPYPAFDLLRRIDYVCLMTSTGCPYRCRYCASPYMNPHSFRQDPTRTLEEISYWHREYGVCDFAFYDDALLVESDSHIIPLLEALAERNMDIRFHTPNALHVREISLEVASLMNAAGFHTIRLGFETADMAMHDRMDRKVSSGDFERAVTNLRNAGFFPENIGAYILMGLPDQNAGSVLDTIEYVGDTGAFPYLAEYSPLPHTPMWKEALASSDFDLAGEPLFHNNTLLPCWDDAQRAKVPLLKRRVREIRKALK